MKIFIHDRSADFVGIAYQMMREGADVTVFIADPAYRRCMDGILNKVESVEQGLKNKPDVVIFSLNEDAELADKIRSDGFKVIGSSRLAKKLEMDRMYGVKVCQQYGVKVPKTVEFSNIEEAIAYAKKEKTGMAIKVNSNLSEASSFVSKDSEEMVDYLNYSKEAGTIPPKATFIIQEKINGAEISTELYYSSGIPCIGANSTFEIKKFLAGELGQRTGAETSLVFHYQDNESKIVAKTLQRLSPLLKYSKWDGPIDVNCIVSEDDHEPYFLEFSPRLGYSAVYAYMALLGMPISEYFYRLSKGPFKIPFRNLWGSALKVSVPPYPTNIPDKKASEETYGEAEGIRVNGKYSKDFIPIDVMKGKTTEFVGAGTSCIIGECIGRGNSMLEAWRGSQKVFKSVEVPNQQGRFTDGAEDAWKRVLKLRQFGYTDIPNPSGGVSSLKTTQSQPA